MRNVPSSGLVAAALGTALIVAGAFPASAQVARPQLGLATSNSDSNLLTPVRGGRVVGGGGRFAMAAGGRFAGGRMGMRGDNRFNVAHRFDRDDFHRRFAVRNNNAFFFGFGDGGWGWNAYAYGGCVIGYDGLTYCPPYY